MPSRSPLCRRCGNSLAFIVESESLSDGTRRIKTYYRCVACGVKVDDELIVIRKNGDKLLVEIKEFRKLREN